MNHISFGSVLKEARISKGYELNAVSRRLRIRPDILEAIENSDFDRMPPRGYSRNMINAYARFLGLNANDVTRMYLDESYANQIGRAHQNAIENRYMHQNTSRATSRPGKRQPTNQFKAVSSNRQRVNDGDTTRSGRRIYSDMPDDNDHMAEVRARAQARQSRSDDPQLHPARREAIPDGKYVNLYANPSRGMGHAPRNRMPIIIGAAVVIIILIVVIVSIVSCSNNQNDVQNIPVTGIESQENGDDQASTDRFHPFLRSACRQGSLYRSDRRWLHEGSGRCARAGNADLHELWQHQVRYLQSEQSCSQGRRRGANARRE